MEDSGLFTLGLIYGLGFIILFANGLADYTDSRITPVGRKKAARTILTSFAWPVVFVIIFIIWLIRTIIRIIRDAI